MTSRRGAEAWGRSEPPPSPAVDVLVGTAGRGAELAVTLAGLAAQDDPPFRLVLSDQSVDRAMDREPAVQAMLRVLAAQGREVLVLRHPERRGIAEHRQWLLDQATADFVLLLDDDVWLEPGQLGRLHDAIVQLGCGFVGASFQGLSFLADRRPEQQRPFAAWTTGVEPERIRKDGPGFERWTLHNAANLAHIAADQGLAPGEQVAYRVAWIAGCTLFRREALVESGGFDFWRDLPPEHGGEDVVAQWRVMERFGGAGLLPSGAVHLEAPTTIPDRRVDAPTVVFGAVAEEERVAG